jgi:AhpC/TSA family
MRNVMRMILLKMASILVFLGVVGCGLKPAGSRVKLVASVGTEALSVYVFSAPWCAECNRELPQLKLRYLADLNPSEQSKVKVNVYVVTGKTPGQAATQQAADDYGKALALPFTMTPDKFYKTYRQYFEEGNAIPAAVLLDSQNRVIQIYEPGSQYLDALFKNIKANLNS